FSHTVFISNAIFLYGVISCEVFSRDFLCNGMAVKIRKMDLRELFWFSAVFALLPISGLANATIDGRVELPPSRADSVLTKRHQIVTHGGVLSTQPPLAVVYLEGSFS